MNMKENMLITDCFLSNDKPLYRQDFPIPVQGCCFESAVCKRVYLYLQACLRMPVMKVFTGSASAYGMPSVGERYSVYNFSLHTNFLYFVVSFRRTSCAPPSTMETAETSVKRAFCWSSGMVSAPQLHMVERTLASVICTLSERRPAYGM